jgi:hypothetical protein
MATQFQVTFDCANPARLAAFWAPALGYVQQSPPEGFDTWEAWLTAMGIPEKDWNSANACVDPDGVGPRLFFQRVPEPKSVKNRVHLDVNVARGLSGAAKQARVSEEVERLTQLGAEKVREVEERGEHWVVMQDPEGNEFCLQ